MLIMVSSHIWPC